jgi:hypothetical protein
MVRTPAYVQAISPVLIIRLTFPAPSAASFRTWDVVRNHGNRHINPPPRYIQAANYVNTADIVIVEVSISHVAGARPTPILFRSRIQGAVLDLLRMHTILPILASWMFKIEHSNKQGDSSSGQFIKGA